MRDGMNQCQGCHDASARLAAALFQSSCHACAKPDIVSISVLHSARLSVRRVVGYGARMRWVANDESLVETAEM